MKRIALTLAGAAALALLAGCPEAKYTADEAQADQQETLIRDISAQTGMPNIVNGRERKLLKMIYELRDQENFLTKTYLVARNTGERRFLCDSMGFPISDATGYTNPDRVMQKGQYGFGTMTQAEPNGLYTPDTSNAHWVMCLDKEKGKPMPTFVNADLVVSAAELSN